MAQQDIRYYLNGLLHGGRGRAAQAGSTDGTASPRKPQIGGKSLARQEVILPRKTSSSFSKLLDESGRPCRDRSLASQAASSRQQCARLQAGRREVPDYGRSDPQNQPKS